MAAILSHRQEMDRIYGWQRHIYDLTRKYYLMGRDGLLSDLKPPAGGSVLEIGCGTGRNLVQAARKYRDAKIYGFDISSLMLSTARSSIAKAGLAPRIRLAQADATSFEPEPLFGVSAFDRVFFSYSLSMIPGWQEALAQSLRFVAPGGELHVVDFGQQEQLPKAFRAALFSWLRRFQVTPRAELGAVFSALFGASHVVPEFRPLFGGYAWRLRGTKNGIGRPSK